MTGPAPARWILPAALLAIAAACVPAAPPPDPADFVVTHAAIHTMDASLPLAESMAVRDGRILFVGTAEGAAERVGPRTRIVDLKGRLVLPAFHDSHVHPVSAGIELGLCDLNGSRSAGEVADRIRVWAGAHPEASWVTGGGWDMTLYPGGNPRKEDLDLVVADRPVLLSSADGHSAWVNTRALSAAGIGAGTPDPPRGRIERDAATGEPSGTLREAAVELAARHAPERTARDHVEGLRRALKETARFGIVSFQEANAGKPTLEAYRTADREGWLTARVRAALEVDPAQGTSQVDRLVEWRRTYRGRRLDSGTAKIFVDGVIEARTAALIEPYLTPAGARPPASAAGIANYEPSALAALVERLDGEGFQVHMHAIGDRAIRMGLDAVEAARRANGPRDARHLMAHLQLIHPDDVPRFQALGVVAGFQPLWAWADPYITELTEPYLGPVRSRWIYPIGAVAATGAVIAAGSDWSVTSLDPLAAIQVAVTRRDPDGGGRAEPWLADQRIDLETAIRAYTAAGAYASFEEKRSGTLAAGKYADFIVLDRNLFEIEPDRIHEARVLWTVMEGSEIYRAPDW